MNFTYIGVGAAGNKAIAMLIDKGLADPNECILINSTRRDIPSEFDDIEVRALLLNQEEGRGCGKERSYSQQLMTQWMQCSEINDLVPTMSDNIIIVSSVEGGTGSGMTPILASYLASTSMKNVNVFAFIGFSDDPRGLQNTVDFFQDISKYANMFSTTTIRNDAYLDKSVRNKLLAERYANAEFCNKVAILQGRYIVPSSQNIDETDLMKVVNCNGYKIIEQINLGSNKILNVEQFNNYIQEMILSSSSYEPDKPSCKKIAIVLNMSEESLNSVDYDFLKLKEIYGAWGEKFLHVQYEGTDQYMQIIVSGLVYPFQSVEAAYNNFKKAVSEMYTSEDTFSADMKNIRIDIKDKIQDSARGVTKAMTKEQFLKSFQTTPSDSKK